MRGKKQFLFGIIGLCVCSGIVLSWGPAFLSKAPYKAPVVTAPEGMYAPEKPNAREIIESTSARMYTDMGLKEAGLSYTVFEKAFVGFLNLQNRGKLGKQVEILTVADLGLSSKKRRLWILDLHNKRVLLNTWVAHGQGSGGDMATEFSNTVNSHQSSLGFYLTGEVYYGKHGRSLRLDGLDAGFNSKARARAIVVHGADYVSQQAINGLNRLGRSHGCPAVPSHLSDRVIDLVKNKSVLYIHGNEPSYSSVYLNKEQAGQVLLAASEQTDERDLADIGHL